MEYILIITIHADPAMAPGYSEWGGTHTYMKEMLDCLTNEHKKCILVTRRAMAELPETEKYSAYCTIYRIKNGPPAPIDKTELYKYHEYNLMAIKQIISEVGTPPKAIHSVYWNSGRLGVELAKQYGVPLIHSVISNSLGRQSRGAKEPVPNRTQYEQQIYDFAQLILCVSDDEKNDLIKFYNIPSSKIVVAGQFIHPSFIMPSRDINGFPRLNSNISIESQLSASINYNSAISSQSSDPFWAYKAFTYFGRIDKSKGVDHIVFAWYYLYQKYGSDCPPLWLIGGSITEINYMRKECIFKCPELVRAERECKIIWWGCIDPIGASTLLLKTLALVTNSLYEPGGRVVVEAMSEGVPVIAAPHGFALDHIKDWVNGFLIDHGNVQGLSLRMEHFIRQPYLSNALGENARQTAANIVHDWDFLGKHLSAYGFSVPNQTGATIKFVNHFNRRELSLFPYKELPLSSEMLCAFVEHSTGDNIREAPTKMCVKGTSDIYRVHGEKQSYVIKHKYNRMALSPIILPFQSHCYIRSASEFYNYEVMAYEATMSDVFVAKDDLHHLLLLRKLEPYNLTHESYPEVLRFLSTECLGLSLDESNKFSCALSSFSVTSLSDVDNSFQSLQAAFPDYYFDAAGLFSPYLGWQLARYLIDYNRSAFSSAHFIFLTELANQFMHSVILPTNSIWYEIIADVGKEHLFYNNGSLCVIDREKRTIGCSEFVIADFILDEIIRKGYSAILDWLHYLMSIIPVACNKKLVVESLTYKLFYETIVEEVLCTSTSEVYYAVLKELREIYSYL